MSRGVSAAATVEALMDLGFSHVVTIPDSESRHLFETAQNTTGLDVITPTREGEGIAIAAGLWTGGAKPVLVIQNTGLMEAGDALRGCGIGPRIPLRLIIGWRGYPGAHAGKLPTDSAYPYTAPLLQAWGIPTHELMRTDDLHLLATMDRTAAATSRPAALLTGWAFTP